MYITCTYLILWVLYMCTLLTLHELVDFVCMRMCIMLTLHYVVGVTCTLHVCSLYFAQHFSVQGHFGVTGICCYEYV